MKTHATRTHWQTEMWKICSAVKVGWVKKSIIIIVIVMGALLMAHDEHTESGEKKKKDSLQQCRFGTTSDSFMCAKQTAHD